MSTILYILLYNNTPESNSQQWEKKENRFKILYSTRFRMDPNKRKCQNKNRIIICIKYERPS